MMGDGIVEAMMYWLVYLPAQLMWRGFTLWLAAKRYKKEQLEALRLSQRPQDTDRPWEEE